MVFQGSFRTGAGDDIAPVIRLYGNIITDLPAPESESVDVYYCGVMIASVEVTEDVMLGVRIHDGECEISVLEEVRG